MKRIISGVVLCLAIAGARSVFAQKETASGVDVEVDISLLRRDIRADKKKIIAANVSFTEAEATKFWPVYDQYVADMAKVNDEFYSLIKDYTATQKVITDAQAATMLKRWVELQIEQGKTRQKYIPLVEKVIPPRKAALFFQIDRRLYALADLQVSAQLPLLIQ